MSLFGMMSVPLANIAAQSHRRSENMKTVSVALSAGMIGCIFSQPISAGEADKYSEKVLYSFCSQPRCADGSLPVAGLIDVKGMLYGTADSGGTSGAGAVFSIDPETDTETVLYSFDGATGRTPIGALIDMKGKLYGTTGYGGSHSCGEGQYCGDVFSFDLKNGTEKEVFSFNGTDGQLPTGSLVAVNGMLYGTTFAGGSTGCGGIGCGTVFSLDPKTGAESVLYSFCGQANCADGENPFAGLIYVNGALYGTTENGGASGGGMVFSVDADTGAETALYSFCSQVNCTDGYYPLGGLIYADGELLGTTNGGGENCQNNGNPGCGTVFSVDPGTGAETVLYSFAGGTDGAGPNAAVILVDGALYGTTGFGGGAGCGGEGCGTVFSVDPGTGAETVLYSFGGDTDGEFPWAGLIHKKGKLYGTTFYGGGSGCGGEGCGTVFALTRNH
jgi:uncharacterized repeat protein (TIGR03803 family)